MSLNISLRSKRLHHCCRGTFDFELSGILTQSDVRVQLQHFLFLLVFMLDFKKYMVCCRHFCFAAASVEIGSKGTYSGVGT